MNAVNNQDQQEERDRALELVLSNMSDALEYPDEFRYTLSDEGDDLDLEFENVAFTRVEAQFVQDLIRHIEDTLIHSWIQFYYCTFHLSDGCVDSCIPMPGIYFAMPSLS